MIKILITGSNGQLGQALRVKLSPHYHVIALNHAALDICNGDSMAAQIAEHQPDLIINSAAYTAVDQAENDKANALAVNAEGAKNLAQIAQWSRTPLIHLSTDYVFSGQQQHPYLETDETHALNYYGQTKILGEKNIQENCDQYLILRVSGLFSEYGNNFVKTILRLAQQKEELKIVSDQITCPTNANNIAETIHIIIEHFIKHKTLISGIYHYCGADAMSWHHFCKKIVELAQCLQPLKVKHIEGISSAEFHAAAIRPSYSVLSCEKIKKDYAITQPLMDQMLPQVITKLLK